jgi:hypothetical protein
MLDSSISDFHNTTYVDFYTSEVRFRTFYIQEVYVMQITQTSSALIKGSTDVYRGSSPESVETFLFSSHSV